MIRILAIVGTRPQYIKHAAMELAVNQFTDLIDLKWIDTGQHYDEEMSEFFRNDFELPKPNAVLNFRPMQGTKMDLEKIIAQIKVEISKLDPNLVMVYGDTTSSLAAALAAKEYKTSIAHVEAGLRSFNLKMPEEQNRIKIDKISDLLFAPNRQAVKYLANEGIEKNVFMSGDVMYDIISTYRMSKTLTSQKGTYVYLSLHRPYNVDDATRLKKVLTTINELNYPIIFPIHPRTLKSFQSNNFSFNDYPNIDFRKPFSYLQNLKYLRYAHRIITDSGGLQKEAYWLRVPCITIRSETEWTETLIGDWNQLVFEDLGKIKECILISPSPSKYQSSLYANGSAAKLIFESIIDFFKQS